MATEKWIAGSGVGLTWSALTFVNGATNELNSLANAHTVNNDTDITNGTALDIFADVSISLGSVTTAAPNYWGVYLYPLNQDGSTYGDGVCVATPVQGSVIPSATYWVGNIIVPVQTAVVTGILTRIILPPGTFRWLFLNELGVTLASSSNTIKYRTYNRSVA